MRRRRDEYFEDRGPADLPHFRPALERTRAVAFVAVVAFVFVEVFGVPHLRVTYAYSGSASSPTVVSASYWSVTGPIERVGGDHPLVKVIPLETPLRDRVRHAASVFVAWAQSQFTHGSEFPE